MESSHSLCNLFALVLRLLGGPVESSSLGVGVDSVAEGRVTH